MRPSPRLVAAVTAAALAFAACSDSDSGDGDGDDTAFPAAGATIAIQGWPSGTAGAVELWRNRQPMGEFAIDATGRFTYTLGVPEGLMPLAPPEGVTASPPDARFQTIIVATTRLSGETSRTGELHVATRLIHPFPVAGDTFAELFYVDRDVTITGVNAGCTYDEDLRAGWNYVIVHVLGTDPYTCTVTASRGLPAGLGWHYQYIGP